MKDLKLAEAGEYLKKHEHFARIAGLTTVILVMSAWTSCSAYKVSKAAEAGIGEAVAIRETATRFSQQFQPASTGETDEWQRTTQEAAEFGTTEAMKMSLAQTVSRIGEVAGMSTVKASFTGSDAVGLALTRNMGDFTFQPATFGLRLEANGSVSAVSRVILRLPPAVDITSLSLAGAGDDVKATFQLAVYQAGGGPQN